MSAIFAYLSGNLLHLPMALYRKYSDIEDLIAKVDDLRAEGSKVTMHLPFKASGSARGFADSVELHADPNSILNYTVTGLAYSEGRLKIEAEEIREPMELWPVEAVDHRGEQDQLIAVEFKPDGGLGGHFRIQHPA